MDEIELDEGKRQLARFALGTELIAHGVEGERGDDVIVGRDQAIGRDQIPAAEAALGFAIPRMDFDGEEARLETRVRRF